MLKEWSLAFALVMIIEGLVYGLYPQGIQKLLRRAAEMNPKILQTAGLLCAVLGAATAYGIVRFYD